jgi:ATP-dependent RNA helicase DDX5/DBP2
MWPIALQGRDLIGIAQTGSGKTLGFILPALVHIMSKPKVKPGDGCVALVLAPTRELAIQIEEVAAMYAPICGIKSLAIYGGVSKYA